MSNRTLVALLFMLLPVASLAQSFTPPKMEGNLFESLSSADGEEEIDSAAVLRNLGIDLKEVANRIPPELRDPKKFEAHVQQIQEEVDRKVGDYSPPTSPLPIVKHIRGKAGIQFEQVVHELPPYLPFAMAFAQLGAEEQLKMMKPYFEKRAVTPICKENRTIKFPTGVQVPKEKDVLIYDLLFSTKEFIPEKTQEVFGSETTVMTFTRDPNDPVSKAIESMAECVPIRYRVTSQFILRDYGVNALQNYTGNQYGTGRQHKFIAEKLSARGGRL